MFRMLLMFRMLFRRSFEARLEQLREDRQALAEDITDAIEGTRATIQQLLIEQERLANLHVDTLGA